MREPPPTVVWAGIGALVFGTLGAGLLSAWWEQRRAYKLDKYYVDRRRVLAHRYRPT